jgi:hypothetical protein
MKSNRTVYFLYTLNLLWIIFAVSGCFKQTEESEVVSAAVANPSAPSRWALGSLPKRVILSSQLPSLDRVEITKAMQAWNEDNFQGQILLQEETPSAGSFNESTPLDSLLDGKNAIYFASKWHPALPSTALAVTQIFGVRQNAGTSQEYLEIVDADIIINGLFRFSPRQLGGYDLSSVIMHEMGHFLGLYHNTRPAEETIMAPYFGLFDFYLNPGKHDLDDIASLYGLSLQSVSTNTRLASSTLSPRQKVETASTPQEVKNSGRGVRLLFELNIPKKFDRLISRHKNCQHRLHSIHWF